MDSAIERIAVIQGAPGNVIEGLIAAFIARRATALRIAGVVAEDHGLPDRSCAAGYLTSIASGKRYSIFADKGADVVECHLDGRGAGAAAESARDDIAAGCDLVVLNKFGKLESMGEGLCRAFDAAIAAGVPLLTSVAPKFADAWAAYAPTGFVILPAEEGAIEDWFDRARARAAAPTDG
jgi:hypothetical protein